MLRRLAEQIKGPFVVLFHALASLVQPAQGVRRKGVSLRHGFAVPLGGLGIVLFHPIAKAEQLADPVLEIVLFVRCLFRRQKRGMRLPEPFLRRRFILVPPHPLE